MNPMVTKDRKAPQAFQASAAVELGMDTIANFFEALNQSKAGVYLTPEQAQRHLELLHQWMGQCMEVENIAYLQQLIAHSGCIAYPQFHKLAQARFREYVDMAEAEDAQAESNAPEQGRPKAGRPRKPQEKEMAPISFSEMRARLGR